MEKTVAFVVLHYQQIKETLKCVESIFKYVENPLVLIIDNCSPNNSGQLLKKEYQQQKNVEVLLLEENMGFAKANNIGYKRAKELGADFICCINNDTELLEEDFLQKVELEFENTGFAVLAPAVKIRDGSLQGFSPFLKNIEEYKSELEIYIQSESYSEYLKKKDAITSLYLRFPRVFGIIRKIKQYISNPYKERMENIVLHGCFLVFSPDYLAKFDTAFNNRTFMYREEELLYLRLRENGLKSVYSNQITVKHLEKASTNSSYTNNEEKFAFVKKCQIESLKILIEELKSS